MVNILAILNGDYQLFIDDGNGGDHTALGIQSDIGAKVHLLDVITIGGNIEGDCG
jgi:hypothetical protein